MAQAQSERQGGRGWDAPKVTPQAMAVSRLEPRMPEAQPSPLGLTAAFLSCCLSFTPWLFSIPQACHWRCSCSSQ